MTKHTYRQYVSLVRDCVAEHNIIISAYGTGSPPDLYRRGHRLFWSGSTVCYHGQGYKAEGIQALREFDAKFELGLIGKLDLDIEDLV